MTALSCTMVAALDVALQNGGTLVRYSGGLWAPAGAPRGKLGRPDCESFPIATVRALVDRGRMRWSQVKTPLVNGWPIEAVIVADPEGL